MNPDETQELAPVAAPAWKDKRTREAYTALGKTSNFDVGNCRQNCSGGNKCLCYRGRHHVLHICKSPPCRCHSREWLDSQRTVRR